MPRLTPAQLATPVNNLTITTAELVNGIAVEAAYVSAQAQPTMTFIESITLPAVSGGRLPVCTGLARHPSGTGWLVGDDGRAPGVSTNDGGVIHYDDNFTTILAHHKAIADWGLTNSHSAQGVGSVPGSGQYWVLLRDIANSSGFKALRINAATGAVVSNFSMPNTSNGLTVDGANNCFWVLQDAGGITKYDMTTGTQIGSGTDLNSDTTNDHVLYNPTRPNRMYVTRGQNGATGVISLYSYNSSNESYSLLDNQNVSGANAIEGACFYNNCIYFCNDGNYHGGTVNAIRVYSVGDLLTR